MGNVLQNTGGNTLKVLAGGGYGSVGDAVTAFFTDSFATGDLTHTENGAAWTDSASTAVSSDRATSGSNSLKFTYAATVDGDAQSEQRFTLGSFVDEIWIKYKLYVPSNYTHRDSTGSDNNKGFFHLFDVYSGAKQLVYTNFWPNGTGGSTMSVGWKKDGAGSLHHWEASLSPAQGVSSNAVVAIDEATDLGAWMTVIIHVKSATPATENGVIQIWKNGSLLWGSSTCDNHYSDATGDNNKFDDGYLLGWSNSGFTAETSFYIDEVEFSATNLWGVS